MSISVGQQLGRVDADQGTGFVGKSRDLAERRHPARHVGGPGHGDQLDPIPSQHLARGIQIEALLLVESDSEDAASSAVGRSLL